MLFSRSRIEKKVDMSSNSPSGETVAHASTHAVAGSPATGARKKRSLLFGGGAAGVVLAAGLTAWGAGVFDSQSDSQLPDGLTKYDLKASDGFIDGVDSTRQEPLMLTSAGTSSDLISGGMEWTVVIKNDGAATGRIFFVLCDPSSAKIKYRLAPGKDEIYPDLFTQLRFTVTDDAGNVVIDNVAVGADEDANPLGDGTVRGDITKVIEANGGEAEFTVKAVFDHDANDLTKTKLAAYTGVDTDFGIRVEGESF